MRQKMKGSDNIISTLSLQMWGCGGGAGVRF